MMATERILGVIYGMQEIVPGAMAEVESSFRSMVCSEKGDSPLRFCFIFLGLGIFLGWSGAKDLMYCMPLSDKHTPSKKNWTGCLVFTTGGSAEKSRRLIIANKSKLVCWLSFIKSGSPLPTALNFKCYERPKNINGSQIVFHYSSNFKK